MDKTEITHRKVLGGRLSVEGNWIYNLVREVCGPAKMSQGRPSACHHALTLTSSQEEASFASHSQWQYPPATEWIWLLMRRLFLIPKDATESS